MLITSRWLCGVFQLVKLLFVFGLWQELSLVVKGVLISWGSSQRIFAANTMKYKYFIGELKFLGEAMLPLPPPPYRNWTVLLDFINNGDFIWLSRYSHFVCNTAMINCPDYRFNFNLKSIIFEANFNVFVPSETLFSAGDIASILINSVNLSNFFNQFFKFSVKFFYFFSLAASVDYVSSKDLKKFRANSALNLNSILNLQW